MKQYIDLVDRTIAAGEWVVNERTGVKCLTVINVDFEYDVSADEFPMLTTKKTYWKSAVAELLGYIRGYDSARLFREAGTKTWDANANENEAWLNNEARRGEDDMGRVYGVQGRMWQKPWDWFPQGDQYVDQLEKVVNNLSEGIDDRGEIITYYNPGEFHLGCLRPCLHSFQFSLVGDTLHMHATQRSADIALGLPFNMIQCYVFLALMARITGHAPGTVFHKIVNAHIYENQLEGLLEQRKRKPFKQPKFYINADIETLDDLETWVNTSNFKVEDYEHHPAINFPFTV